MRRSIFFSVWQERCCVLLYICVCVQCPYTAVCVTKHTDHGIIDFVSLTESGGLELGVGETIIMRGRCRAFFLKKNH